MRYSFARFVRQLDALYAPSYPHPAPALARAQGAMLFRNDVGS